MNFLLLLQLRLSKIVLVRLPQVSLLLATRKVCDVLFIYYIVLSKDVWTVP